MSIFKIKQWWSSDTLRGNEIQIGTCNVHCLKVDKFNSHSDSDCIIIGEENCIKVYKPSPNSQTSDTVIETRLNDVVLHVETGKFLAGNADRQILVLHPQSYAIYQLVRKEGHTDAGEQNVLNSILKRSFTRKAHNLTAGPFGNIKTRDLICIQSLDGHLSFFDQDTFLFMCMFNDVIIPGPVCYIASSDSFVIYKSTWVLEIFSYQQLREFSELSMRQNKKNIPQWIYNAGEEISSVQVIQTSSNFSSIVAMGERHLYCFQDNGLMKYMIRFDFMPLCFHAYLIGWFYEPGARLLVMVSSEDSKIYIYENTTLLWSCDLLHKAISIHRCFIKALPGGIVSLATNGVIDVSYLGTEPNLNSNAGTMMNEVVDPNQVHSELESVEEELQIILENREDTSLSIEQMIKIKADVGKPIQKLKEFGHFDEAIHLLMCPVVIMMTCDDPKLIPSIQVTYICCSPFTCSESTICLDNINGTEIIETQVFMSNSMDISDTRVNILFTVTDCAGKIVVFTRTILLPISLYCSPVDMVAENQLNLLINSNHPCLELTKIFTDFSEEDLLKQSNSADAITFKYRNTKKTVALKTSDKNYTIKAEEFSDMTAILDYFIWKLKDHYLRMGVKDFCFKIKYDKEFVKQVMHKFLKSIEIHAKERVKLKKHEDELNILQRQFTLVQKRLLVQYGSLPPGDCDSLEFLMRDTHKRLVNSVQEIIQGRESVNRAGATLTSVGQLIIFILKQTTTDDFKIKLIEEMLSLSTIYDLYQEWEESVTQALSYILNNVLQKSEKDKEKLAPVTEQGILSHINLKRFLKQIRMVLDKMFMEGLIDELDEHPKEQITRIEEFVEVL